MAFSISFFKKMFKTFNCSSKCCTRNELKSQDCTKQLLGFLATPKGLFAQRHSFSSVEVSNSHKL